MIENRQNLDKNFAAAVKAMAVDKSIKKRIVRMLDNLFDLRGDMYGYRERFIHVYFNTLLFFTSYSDAVALIWKKAEELNAKSTGEPLYEHEVQHVINQFEEKTYSYGNDNALIGLFDITEEEIEKLGLLEKQRRAVVAKLNNEIRNKKRYLIREYARAGIKQKEICAMVNEELNLWGTTFECNLSYVKRYSSGARGSAEVDAFPMAYAREKKSQDLPYPGLNLNAEGLYQGCGFLSERIKPLTTATSVATGEPNSSDTFVGSEPVDNINIAWEAYKTGSNLTVLGKAGTGKSTLIRRIVDDCNASGRKCVVAAPGGLAAHNAGGRTVCSTFGLRFKDVYPKNEPVSVTVLDEIFDADVLVVDEIGTLRADMGLQVIRTIKHLEETQSRRIQVVWLGDFTQTPPVCPEEHVKKLKNMGFETGWLFDLPEWRAVMGQKIVLSQSFRQAGDTRFEQWLDLTARGDKKVVNLINSTGCRDIDPDAVYIVSRRSDALRLNLLKAAQIAGERRAFRTREGLLWLAVGMRVMTTSNKGDAYQNGSLGWVSAFNEKSLKIRFDDGHEARIDAFRDGTFPVALAYAITVHKAQGMTFDSINLLPGFFAAGQL